MLNNFLTKKRSQQLFNSYFRRKKKFVQIKYKYRMVNKIAITITNSNTFINLSCVRLNSKKNRFKKARARKNQYLSHTLTYTSAGLCGFKGTHKASPMANYTIGELAAIKFKKYGLRHIYLHVAGRGKRMIETLRGLSKYGLAIEYTKRIVRLPHNGTRHKKVRRK
jgi:ribosomal protein S11